jgi:hypothetical protein
LTGGAGIWRLGASGEERTEENHRERGENEGESQAASGHEDISCKNSCSLTLAPCLT